MEKNTKEQKIKNLKSSISTAIMLVRSNSANYDKSVIEGINKEIDELVSYLEISKFETF